MPLSEESKIAVLETEMKLMTKSMDNLVIRFDMLTDKIDSNYVKVVDFNPIKKQVEDMGYWQAKVIGVGAAVGAIVSIGVTLFVGWLTRTH